MELTGVGPGRKPGDTIEFAEELANHLAGIFALADLLDLRHQPGKRVFGLRDRNLGVILALTLETGVVLVELLTEEVGETLAGHIPDQSGMPRNNTVRQTSLEDHLERNVSQSRYGPAPCQSPAGQVGTALRLERTPHQFADHLRIGLTLALLDDLADQEAGEVGSSLAELIHRIGIFGEDVGNQRQDR